MNEAEKKAFAALSEEEQQEVSGGETIDETSKLTEEQCVKLRKVLVTKPIIDYPLFRPTLCKYGGPGMFDPKHKPVLNPKLFPEKEPIEPTEEHTIEN